MKSMSLTCIRIALQNEIKKQIATHNALVDSMINWAETTTCTDHILEVWDGYADSHKLIQWYKTALFDANALTADID